MWMSHGTPQHVNTLCTCPACLQHVCVYVCARVYTYVCMYVHVCEWINMSTRHAYVSARMCTCVKIYFCTYHACVYKRCMYVCMYVCMHVRNCIWTYLYDCVSAAERSAAEGPRVAHFQSYVYMHVIMYVRMYISTYVCLYVFVCVYVYMYACMCVGIDIWMCIWISKCSVYLWRGDLQLEALTSHVFN